MIAHLRAFVWLRWRLLANSARTAGRRDAMEQFSRTMALAVPALLLVLVLATMLIGAVVGAAVGWALGKGIVLSGYVLLAVRAALAGVLAMLVLVPLSVASSGATTRTTRLVLLPISRRLLHFLEVVSTLADPWIAVALPGVLLIAGGLLLAGRAGTAAVALVAALGFVAVLASLGALVASLLSWLLRGRRRGEIFTLVFVIVLSVGGMIPAFMVDDVKDRTSEERAERRARFVERIDESLPAWTRVIPSELYGNSVAAGLEGRTGAAWGSAALLLLEALVLYGASSSVHRRLIESVESGGGRRRASVDLSPMAQLPGLTPAAAAVAAVQARTALRSVRGRLVVFLPGPIVALLGLLVQRVPDAIPWFVTIGSQGHLLLGVGLVFCLYSLQGFNLNQFTSDRAGLTLQLLLPVSDEDLVKGKAIGCGVLFVASALLCLVGVLIVAPVGSPFAWASVMLGATAVYMLMSPVAAAMSALFPVASDLSKTGSGGNPHGVSMVVGTALVGAVGALPGLVLVLGERTGRHDVGLLLIALLTIASAFASIRLLARVAPIVARRRENLALVAQGR